jgi:hypothetical protein
MTKGLQQILAFVFGVAFVVVLLVLAVEIPNPTSFQYTTFRVILALAASGIAVMIPGFLHVTISTWIRAGGALGVFVVVFFFNPASLVSLPDMHPVQQSITNGNNNTQLNGDKNNVVR